MAKIVVHITGSIAAFKAVTVVRMLQKAGHQVRVAMTKSATKLIGPATLASLTHYPVMTDLWEPSTKGQIPHIELADWADYSLVVPASADIIAKMANGIADDPVSTTLLATPSPVVVVPAMNTHMWQQPATQRNIARLIQDGKVIMQPVHGKLAEGYVGDGRMPEPIDVVNFFNGVIHQSNELASKRIIISLGGTLSPIDPVRYIGNRSSGKMGWAIAQAAYHMGAQVDVVAGRTSISLPKLGDRMTIYRVQTTQDMYETINQLFDKSNALIMAAAVADFKVTNYADQKIKKVAGQEQINLQLEPNIDILKTFGEQKKDQLTIGFAAETQDVIENAQQKLTSKHADLIIANDVSQSDTGFNADTNKVTILRPGYDPESWAQDTKQAIGVKLMQLVNSMLKK
ncbi:bifunctional phosphopantothenoylcysteine decarboxylase/phosphopantothenate--cysteine ligase CoaBC [Limosilactobacillus coleohominis]|uniref:bifunctional phosphopantothenoylcysteine decarboxylase/phosphopantothenate--cysteine ligase CoaBC n=1 Tax=Limosilactobacillus coleohominis TaxID=181675 RepID=UPI00195CBDA0|nr:bifunctional phosphopantothenoylcysteine decarboxylase/phosphopantothenate--cysteine ligase CoaBC [Limosilactobacillus coleohominis]MBM6954689.1 bifunctional phosphopantothenoylcysteine decarboxylase/phosphopantothenate--cysteine ligase CoaBC [Limosilactobacillus coleohominis]